MCDNDKIVEISLAGAWSCVDQVSPDYLPLNNCLQTGVKVVSATVKQRFCVICDNNHSPFEWVSYTFAGWGTTHTAYFGQWCENIPITNCLNQWFDPTSSLGTTTASCYGCMKDYALNSNGTTCTSYVTDPYCRVLDSTGTGCSSCWYSYWFNGTVCYLRGGLAVVGGVLLIMAVFMLE